MKKTLTQQRNRLANSKDKEVQASLHRIIDTLSDELAQLEERIDNFIDSDEDLQADKALIASIQGVGDATAHMFLSEMPDLARYQSASAAAADVGIR